MTALSLADSGLSAVLQVGQTVEWLGGGGGGGAGSDFLKLGGEEHVLLQERQHDLGLLFVEGPLLQQGPESNEHICQVTRVHSSQSHSFQKNLCTSLHILAEET